MTMDDNGSRKWKLSMVVIVGLSMWVAAFVLLVVAILVLSIQKDHLLIGTAVRLLAMLVAAMGASGYIYVSATVERPAQLHRNGLLPLLMLPEIGAMTVSRLLGQRELGLDGNPPAVAALSYCIRPFIAALFIRRVKEKICSLGPPAGPCTNFALWANLLVALTFVPPYAGLLPLSIRRAFFSEDSGDGPVGGGRMGGGKKDGQFPGNTTVEDNETGEEMRVEGGGGKTLADDAGPLFVDVTQAIARGSLLLLGVMYVVAIVVAMRYVSAALARLVQRDVRDERLSKVRRTISRHVLGMLLGFAADLVFIIATTVDLQDFFKDESPDDMITAAAHLIDASGHTIGVLLLSGVGALLLGRDSPDVGDVTGKLRGLMHAAVLTSRADTVFEGRVAKTSSMRCVASFPGKYVQEWNELTWLCEQGDLSCACVFLPGSDPQKRFGRHVECPDTPGHCWCESLYGGVQPWGCLWFDAWRQNIEEAVSLGLEFVVVYFPDQVGRGHVLWEDLGTSHLWDGCGLGGSQKAEVAYLRKRGIHFLEEDLRDFQRAISPKR